MTDTPVPRRIAHVVSTPVGIGGAEKVLLALVAGGAARGWEQVVLNPFDVTPSDSALATELGSLYLARRTTGVTEIGRARGWLRGELQAFRPDVMHAHLFHALVLAATLPRKLYRQSVLSHQHGQYFRIRGRPVAERLDRWAGRRYNQVVACSDWVRDFLVTEYGYRRDRVRTIHNGWSGEPLVPNRSASTPTVVCVGRLRPEKGHATLLRSFESVLKDFQHAQLVLVGDGPLRAELEAQAVGSGIANSVRFEGDVDDVWPYLAAAHVVALPSLFEALGIAILEAMAAGAPVVATDVGGVPELIKHDASGLLVPPENADALGNSIKLLLASPRESARLGDAGREVAENFRMQGMVARYFSLYEELLDQPEGP
jgi:glycosyltransferase involved in cell wall biosynthesis